MKCKCGNPSQVVDSRPSVFNEIPTLRRRRKCTVCSERFTTYEFDHSGIALLDEQISTIKQFRDTFKQLIDELVNVDLIKEEIKAAPVAGGERWMRNYKMH